MSRISAFVITVLLLTFTFGEMSTAVMGSPAAVPESKLLPIPPAADASFGQTVAIDGNTAVVGAPNEANGGDINVGAAYVFTFDGAAWSQAARLTASDGAAGDLFGTAVAIDDGTIVVGARGQDEFAGNAGAAYVFTGSGSAWSQADKLLPSSMGDNAFGFTVAVDGDRIAVGAPYTGSGTTNSGAAYIFDAGGSGWTETTRLATGGGGAVLSDLFGAAISLSGDLLLVGAYLDNVVYAYAYNGSTWAAAGTLKGVDTQSGDQFGYAVAVDGNTAVVGAAQNDTAGNNSGAAYFFERTGANWVQRTKVAPSGNMPGSRLGWSVALDGDRAIVGARNSKGLQDKEESGASYIYERLGTTWLEVMQLNASAGASFDHFGESVSISGGYVAVGAPGHGASGAAYVYKVGDDNDDDDPPPPDGPQNCLAAEQTVEEVLPGVFLTWDSAHRCNNTPAQGQYAFTVSLEADSGSTKTLILEHITLTHTTPRPLGNGPEATVEQLTGFPVTLSGGESDSFSVRGAYELVTTGEGQKANLHFCASGHDQATGEPFYLGINTFLRSGSATESDDGPPPTISNINVTAGPLSALITWQTDQPATSRVVYYRTDQPEMQHAVAKGCLAAQNHEVKISGLLPETEYTFQIQSQTGIGDAAISGSYTFTTAELGEKVYLPTVLR